MQITHYRTNAQYFDHLATEAKRRWNEAHIAGASKRGELGVVRQFQVTGIRPGTISIQAMQAMTEGERRKVWASATACDKVGLVIEHLAMKNLADENIPVFLQVYEERWGK